MPLPALDESPACPDAPPCPRCPGFDLDLELPPSWQAGDHLTIRGRPGWSPSTRDFCWSGEGQTNRAGQSSAVAQLSTPPDCLALPEAPPLVALGFGLLLLALLANARDHRIGPVANRFQLVKRDDRPV